MKHYSLILFFALFFTLTSANRDQPEPQPQPIQVDSAFTPSKKIFAPPSKTNNLVIKAKAEGIGLGTRFDEVYDDLPQALKPPTEK